MRSRNTPRGKSSPRQAPPPSRGPQRSAGPRREPEIPKSWRAVAGTHALNEAFGVRPHQIKAFWLRQGWESSQDLRELEEKARKAGVSIETKPVVVLDRLCATHQGA
ncbi:MAG TPA: RNA methyltransferase substrate-binding domain-containing protein, partial [Pseudobdellovibrionaceae bacterium]|nr:RNA methyltransferase substrate-binding domain-containing protein [Pseudobdellovibrionaceae bacterium]